MAFWRGVRDRTVKVVLSFGDNDVTRNDFVYSLTKAKISPADVRSIGLVDGRRKVWNITFKTEDLAERYAAQGVVDVGRGQGTVSSLSKRILRLKILWLPYYMPKSEIEDYFAQFGEVVNLEFERPRRTGTDVGPLDHASGTTRILLLKTDWEPEKLPYRVEFSSPDEKFFGLVAIAGRRPRCFRCGQIGHERRECETPMCIRCNTFAHTPRECPKILAELEEARKERAARNGEGSGEKQVDRQVQADRQVQGVEVSQADQGTVDQGKAEGEGDRADQVEQVQIGEQGQQVQEGEQEGQVQDRQVQGGSVEEGEVVSQVVEASSSGITVGETQESRREAGSEVDGVQVVRDSQEVGDELDRMSLDSSVDSDKLVIDEGSFSPFHCGQRPPDTMSQETEEELVDPPPSSPPSKKVKKVT